MFLEIDGGAPLEIKAGGTAGAFVPVSCEWKIATGVHTIRLSNPWTPMPDIDRMDLVFP